MKYDTIKSMFTNPEKNLRTLGLNENDVVADLGAGTGFYSIPAGRIVTGGKVYAIEIVKDFLATIKKKVHDAHLHNVEILWGNIEKKGGTGLGDGVADAVIASNVLFQVDDKETFIEETKRILKPKGKVLLVDWSTESSALFSKKFIPKHKTRDVFERKGFLWQRDINAEAHHYGMIFIKK